MREDVKISVSARLDMFDKYYTVSDDVKPEVDAFVSEVTALGERSGDTAAFEAEFVSSGLSERFNNLLVRCTPKPYRMTDAEKANVKQVKQEMAAENPGGLVKDIAADVTDSLLMKAESDMIAKGRKDMINAGVFDEYTKATNAVEDAGWLAKKLGKLFGKK